MSRTVVSWIGWHIGELACVIVAGVVALTVTPWAAVVSAVIAASWAAHEVRLARQQAAITTSWPSLDAGRSEEDTPDPAVGWGDA